MLQPKKRKYFKDFRGKRRGMASRGREIDFGEYGLKSVDSGWVSSRQIEAARRTITHHTKRGGKLWTRIFPDKPITKKAAGARMGGGKGDIEQYVAVVRPGMVLFELAGTSVIEAREAMRKAAHKLPVLTKFIEKHRG